MLATPLTTQERVTLEASNLNEFIMDQKKEHAAKARFLSDLFNNVRVSDIKMPVIDDKVENADGTLTGTYRFDTTVVNGVTTLTAAGIKSFESANIRFLDLVEKRRTLSANVLLDMQNHISNASLLKIQSQSGGTYDDICADLLKFYPVVVSSHSKSDPVSMMEAMTKLFKCTMTASGDDYYRYIHDLTERKKVLEVKFGAYLDRTGHVMKFIDTICVLQLALGINKRPEYTSALERLRATDFSKPPATGALQFHVFLDMLTNATISSSVLLSIEGGESPYLGAGAKTRKERKLVADSSETTKVQCNCEECKMRFDVVKNFKTGLPFTICKKCHQARQLARKQKEDAAKKAGSEKRGGPIPQKSNATKATALSVVVPPAAISPGSVEYMETYNDYADDSS